MSISFTAEDSPRGEDRVFDCCDHPECPHCQGTEEVRFETLEYDVNMSNGSAWPYTALFTSDGKGDHSGYIEAVDVPEALNILQAQGTLIYQISSLCRVFQWAADNNKGISWG